MKIFWTLMAVVLTTSVHADTMRLSGNYQAFSEMGKAVAMQGNHALVGVPNGPQMNNNTGVVATYQRLDGQWVKGEDLRAADGQNGDSFGFRMALDKNRVAVAAVTDNVLVEETFYEDLGSVHIFELDDAGQWQATAQLLPPVLANESYFGLRIALSGNHLMVQAGDPNNSNQTNRGVVYVYRLMAGEWQWVDTIEPPVANTETVLGSWAIELQGNRAFISNSYVTGEQLSGVILTYERRGLEWVQLDEIKLTPFDPNDSFGFAVSAWQDVLAIGAPGTNDSVGAVHVYGLDNGSWTWQHTLSMPTGIANQLYGWDLDLQQQQLFVSSIHDAAGDFSGAVYDYHQTDQGWQLVERLDSGFDNHNDFGSAISADGGQVLIGADYQGTFRGAAYMSTVSPAAETLPLNQGLNGAWFNPAIPGQGIFLDVNAAADFAFMGLFSYDTTGGDALAGQIGAPGQRWLVGAAGIDQHHESIHFELYYAYDGLFDDARAVQVSDTAAYGWLTMTFKSCLEAEVSYHITEPNLSGSMLMTRPAAGSGTLCNDLASSEPAANDEDFNYALNGGWFNTETGGQGLFIDKFKGIDTAFMGWFTFDTELVDDSPSSDIGSLGQRWLVGTGEVDPDDAHVINYELYYTYGGRFLDDTEVTVVEPGSYGVLRVEFVDCNQARVDYTIGEGGLTGSYDMVRSIPDPSGCAEAN